MSAFLNPLRNTFRPKAVGLAGASYLSRGADFAGSVDGKAGMFSAWLRFHADNATQIIASSTTTRILIQKTGGNLFTVLGKNAAGTTILSMSTVNAYTGSPDRWLHLLIGWDLVNTQGWIYVNGQADLAGGGTFTNDLIDNTVADHTFGAGVGGATPITADAALVYLNTAAVLGLGNAGNRAKFIDTNGRPVDLGAAGATPTGTAPILFLSGNAASFATNLGGGGGMTLTGALTNVNDPPGS